MEQTSGIDEQNDSVRTKETIANDHKKIPIEEQDKTETDNDGNVQIDIAKLFSDALSDLVNEHVERANEAEVLLGGCLDMVCTYPEGYKIRQPLYSCKTCAQLSGKLSGICYGCSENCHDGHELIELYTKRNFCCDCGNSKFTTQCKLYEGKDPLNVRNKYNDNFEGNFCVCKKPYPPPELKDETEVEDMIQCCVCEDWFHPSHIFDDLMEKSKLDSKDNENFDLVCLLCMQKFPWLAHYKNLEKDEIKQFKEEKQQQDQPFNDKECELIKLESANKQNDLEPFGNDEKLKNRSMCFANGWRERLCRCSNCMVLYENSECLFLLDNEDTIESYEQRGYEQMERLKENKNIENKQDFLQPELAITLTSGIEQMKQHCVEFFSRKTVEKRGAEAITKEDVEECFQELEIKRKRLLDQMDIEQRQNAAWTE